MNSPVKIPTLTVVTALGGYAEKTACKTAATFDVAASTITRSLEQKTGRHFLRCWGVSGFSCLLRTTPCVTNCGTGGYMTVVQ